MTEQKNLLLKPIAVDFHGGTVVLIPPQEWEIDHKQVMGVAQLAINMTKPTGNFKPVRAVIFTRPAMGALKEMLNNPASDALIALMPESITDVPQEFLKNL